MKLRITRLDKLAGNIIIAESWNSGFSYPMIEFSSEEIKYSTPKEIRHILKDKFEHYLGKNIEGITVSHRIIGDLIFLLRNDYSS
jgi:hypothetical protein